MTLYTITKNENNSNYPFKVSFDEGFKQCKSIEEVENYIDFMSQYEKIKVEYKF